MNTWLAKGSTVVVNGSRGYLKQAQSRYPELLPVAVTVTAKTLQERLLARGREGATDIAQRLQRAVLAQASASLWETIDNNGPLSRGGDALVALIRRHVVLAERA